MQSIGPLSASVDILILFHSHCHYLIPPYLLFHSFSAYCSITNCSSPLCDCDTPDECFILSPCLKACDKPPILSRAIIFSADRLRILGGFENGECKRMKINSTRVEKSKILAKLPNLDVCHILDLSLAVMLGDA
jgi:hypothetical protein